MSRSARTALLLTVLGAALPAAIIASSAMGFVHIPLWTVVKVIGSGIAGNEGALEDFQELYLTIVFDVRLPRILTAAAVGSGLALSGVVFQGLLLNPLADPYTLGVSAGAAFGASLALLFNVTFFGQYTVAAFAFVGAALTLAAVISLSASAGGVSSNNLILSGVIVTAILSAGISLCKYLAQERVSVIVFWLLGSFASSTWADAGLTWLLTAAGFAVFLYFGRDLNLLCLGGRTASSLGVEPARVRLILLLTGSCLAAACVSVSGIIGFVGLLVPHMMRSVTGPDHFRLLPASLLVGGILLLGADTVTRSLLPAEVPIGVLTALIGGPFFCFIFRKRQMAI